MGRGRGPTLLSEPPHRTHTRPVCPSASFRDPLGPASRHQNKEPQPAGTHVPQDFSLCRREPLRRRSNRRQRRFWLTQATQPPGTCPPPCSSADRPGCPSTLSGPGLRKVGHSSGYQTLPEPEGHRDSRLRKEWSRGRSLGPQPNPTWQLCWDCVLCVWAQATNGTRHNSSFSNNSPDLGWMTSPWGSCLCQCEC